MQTEETQMQQAFQEAYNQMDNGQQDDVAPQDETVEQQLNSQETAEDMSAETESENEQGESQETESADPKDLIVQIEQLKNQLVQEQEKHKADCEKLVRALAECENQKKRIEADVERERKFGNEKILKALIPVVDSLELALKHSNIEDPAVKPTIEGVQNTVTLLLKELGSFGVQGVDPQGQPFDPNLHQAISMVPSAEVGENCVLSVMQKGYTLNGRVVRPAMVIVSSGAPAQPANGASDGESKNNSINIEA
ncbi:MAG: nucleotide exchange factor GrpE [Succinivibrio sp.]